MLKGEAEGEPPGWVGMISPPQRTEVQTKVRSVQRGRKDMTEVINPACCGLRLSREECG